MTTQFTIVAGKPLSSLPHHGFVCVTQNWTTEMLGWFIITQVVENARLFIPLKKKINKLLHVGKLNAAKKAHLLGTKAQTSQSFMFIHLR